MSAESGLETTGDITTNLPMGSTLIQAENGKLILTKHDIRLCNLAYCC